VSALNAPDTKARFDTQGFDVVANTPDQFATFLKSEIGMWQKVVETGGIKPTD
jgi:tripartite-type tricarboxylate transporter receptor subunit TctC